MGSLSRVFREHPVGFLVYVALMGFIVVRLGYMLRRTWGVARTPKDRWAILAFGTVLTLAFCGLCTFLFLSLFA